MRGSSSLLASLLAVVSAGSAFATEYFVDAAKGSDSNDGLSPASAFKSVQKAASSVAPGDAVKIADGVYFEHVRLERFGVQGKPIVFKASSSKPGGAIISGAFRPLREGKLKWSLEDGASGLYSIPYERPWPARVLYSGCDLYPYKSLDALKSFMANESNPGPKHGFFYDALAMKLYVRLHASGKYGSPNPNERLMAVSPPTGPGTNGVSIKASDSELFNFGVLAGPGRSAFVEIAGLSFETPGVAGVFVDGNDVAVRDCVFRGCRVGVLGRTPQDFGPKDGYASYSDRILLERCDYTQFPAFQDVRDCLLENAASPSPRQGIIWWQRKNSEQGCATRAHYETGIAGWIGDAWEISRCRVWDCFEGLGAVGTRHSRGLKIHDCLFQGVADNAVEFEDHSVDMRVFRNALVDVFMPFSWQPLKGPPWPGPVQVYGNLVRSSKENAFLWRDGAPNAPLPAPFKFGASLKQWNGAYAEKMKAVSKDAVAVPEPGLLVYNNTVWTPGGKLFEVIGGYEMKLLNVKIFNNVFVAARALQALDERAPSGGPGSYEYAGNLAFLYDGATPFAAKAARLFDDLAPLGLRDPENGDFSLRPSSPALDSCVEVPGALESFKDAGCLQRGQTSFAIAPSPVVKTKEEIR